MYDARTFLNNLEDASKILEKNNAVLRGDYVIHDIIYSSKDREPLDKIFLRLRLIPKNIWNEKPVVVVIKNTEIKEVGKKSIIPLKKEFDTKEEAKEFIKNNYSNQFEFSYEFDRIGWQYDLGEDQIDLEDIEGYYSIEFKSKTEDGLKSLLSLFNITDVISGSSVTTIKEILKR